MILISQSATEIFFVVIPSFLLGAIPAGYLICRALGIDVRNEGSGNIGATNVRRVAGAGAGTLTFALDFLKGFCATFLASSMRIEFLQNPEAVAGLSAVIGHCYSPFLVGKGGKGVATAFGVFLRLAPLSAFLGLVMFGLVVKIWRMVSLGSLISVWTVIFVVFRYYPVSLHPYALLIAILISSRHIDNIKHILDGTERVV